MQTASLTGAAADRELRDLTRRLRASRQMKAAIAAGAAPELPVLAGEQIKARKTPSNVRWAPLRRPRRARPIDQVEEGLQVEVSDVAIRVTHPGRGIGFRNFGRRGQAARAFLPEKDLPKRWKDRMAQAGLGALGWYLGRGVAGFKSLRKLVGAHVGAAAKQGRQTVRRRGKALVRGARAGTRQLVRKAQRAKAAAARKARKLTRKLTRKRKGRKK